MPLDAGRQLGPYEIVSAIGAGGMGEVYKARDTRLDRTVAIKVLPEHVAADPDLKQRFEREAKTISSLNHPHICTLHDIGNQDEIDFLVMEYLDGKTLAQRLEQGALPLDQALKIAIEIADALDKAHRQGIRHRDLKPGNIMPTTAGTVPCRAVCTDILHFSRRVLAIHGKSGACTPTSFQKPPVPLCTPGGRDRSVNRRCVRCQPPDAPRSPVLLTAGPHSGVRPACSAAGQASQVADRLASMRACRATVAPARKSAALPRPAEVHLIGRLALERRMREDPVVFVNVSRDQSAIIKLRTAHPIKTSW